MKLILSTVRKTATVMMAICELAITSNGLGVESTFLCDTQAATTSRPRTFWIRDTRLRTHRLLVIAVYVSVPVGDVKVARAGIQLFPSLGYSARQKCFGALLPHQALVPSKTGWARCYLHTLAQLDSPRQLHTTYVKERCNDFCARYNDCGSYGCPKLSRVSLQQSVSGAIYCTRLASGAEVTTHSIPHLLVRFKERLCKTL